MTIYTGGARRAPVTLLEQQPVSTPEVLDAFMDDPTISPMEMIRRFGRRGVAQEGQFITETHDEFTGVLEDDTTFVPPKTEVLSVEEQQERITGAGVPIQPKEGMRSEVLDILIEAKQEELARSSTISRASAGQSVLGFVGAVGASALDPLNVASAFVPVIPAARYTSMLGNAGSSLAKAGVRARVGAAEGFAGALMLEPLIYGLATDEQADYTLADSMMNIALGTSLGGGLHMGLGALSDAVKKGLSKPRPHDSNGRVVDSLSVEQRQNILRTSIALAIDDRRPNIGIADPVLPVNPVSTARLLEKGAPEFKVDVTFKDGVQAVDIVHEAKARNQELVDELDTVTSQLDEVSKERADLQARADEVTPLVTRITELKEQLKTADKRKSKRLERNITKAQQELEALGFKTPAAAKTFLTKSGKRIADIDKTLPDMGHARDKLDRQLSREIDKMLQRDPVQEGVRHRVESIQAVSNLRQYDEVQLQRVDEVLSDPEMKSPDTVDVADSQLQNTIADVTELADEIGLNVENVIPKELDDELVQIDRYEQALRSMSACALRTP